MAVEQKVLTITEFTRRIKGTLEGAFGVVTIEGEISNLTRPISGHLYFTLKDEGAQIGAVMFKGSQRLLAFIPQNGMMVRATGGVSVYEKRGNYQFWCAHLKKEGRATCRHVLRLSKRNWQKRGSSRQNVSVRCRCCPSMSALSLQPPAQQSVTF